MGDDGVWQDGGLLICTARARPQWVAVFLAFQSQAWHTDDKTGHALPTAQQGEPAARTTTMRIVAALVNPVGPAPEHETVTLLNTRAEPVDLAGWAHRRPCQAAPGPPGHPVSRATGDASRSCWAPVALGNRGGLITLLDPDGLKVDGVAYTNAQAEREGWSLVF